ncbi:hypothetical protein UlMin_023541 [Ulmus minor]
MLSRSSSSNSVPAPGNWYSARDYDGNYGRPFNSGSRSFGANLDSRGSMDAQRSFERRAPSLGSTSSPTQLAPVQIVALSNNPPRESISRPRHMMPALPRLIDRWPLPAPYRAEVESGLSYAEQNKALGQLKKEIYNPNTKRITTKVNLYYRDIPVNTKDLDNEAEGKRCTICLEEFERGQEVMITPCKHMFHEECILPWIKSSGQCPVCRFSLGQKTTQSALPLNRNTITSYVPGPGLSHEEIVSILRALGGPSLYWG